MKARAMKLAVIKQDGTTEGYFHTKVFGTIANALAGAGQPDIAAAEELAEAVTFFLYRGVTNRKISASEVLSIIQAVLANTGYEEAAVALSEHHFERRLKRSRVEVISGRLDKLTDAGKFREESVECFRSRWDKFRIIRDLVNKHGLERQTARTIASMVEEKVFNMGLSAVPAGLVRQLVLNDAEAVIRAQRQLQMA